MINRLTEKANCPKCGGRVFIDQDYYGWYSQCLLCGYLQNLEKVTAAPAKTSYAVSTQPVKVRRTKIKV
jgi:hypothetical protein